jgi:hypothetical protein
MGTREGVEKIQNVPSKDKPPTKEQDALIKSLIKKSPEAIVVFQKTCRIEGKVVKCKQKTRRFITPKNGRVEKRCFLGEHKVQF